MFTDNPSKRLVISLSVAATNIFSFAFGITVAGERPSGEPIAAATVSATPTPSPKRPPKVVAQHPAAPKPAAAPAPVRQEVAAPPKPAAAPASPISGKGFWIYEFEKVGKGNVHRIVNWAKQHGLTHIYVRAGTSRSGLNSWHHVARLLPVAHAAGIKVIPWFFPYLKDPIKDAQRSLNVIGSVVNGHRIDGFAADIETPAEGTHLSATRVKQYVNAIRARSPRSYLILVPPRPTPSNIHTYPFKEIVPRFNAVAPMVYWGGSDPAQATAAAVAYLKMFGKPVAPIGQAYDMGPEGGPRGRPRPPAIRRFLAEAKTRGSVGVSFWSWQHAGGEQWDTLRAFPW